MFRTCRFLFLLAAALGSAPARAQVQGDSAGLGQDRTLPALTLHAYVEGYLAVDGNRPAGQERPLLYNFSREREFSVNLAYLEVSGQTADYRFKFVPSFGSYMQANYVGEPEGFRFLFEANAGLCLSARRGIWFDAGVLPSPFGYEGAISLFQNTLTRSLSAEYSPYFLTGARLSVPLSARTSLYLFAINGWQIIRETNGAKSAAAQLQHKVSDRLLLNYSLYLGDERTPVDNLPGTAYRHFHDLYAVYTPSRRLSLVALFDIGFQNGYHAATEAWFTAHFTSRIALAPKLWANLRAELFSDPLHAHIYFPNYRTTITGGSAGLSYGIADRVQLRAETRLLSAANAVFADTQGRPTPTYWMNTVGLSVFY